MSTDSAAQVLVDRYPSMFQQHEMLDIFAGWLGPIATLCSKVNARLSDGGWTFQFLQIKEKLGICRIYFHLDATRSEPKPDVASQDLAALRKAIEKDIEHTETVCGSRCMVCGRHASTRNYGAVLATLCERHELSETFRDPWSLAKLPITAPRANSPQNAEARSVRLEWVRKGLLIDSSQFGLAWDASQDVLATACRQNELFRLRIDDAWFYPAVFATLPPDVVRRINLALKGDDAVDKFIFWHRKHGGLRALNVKQALLADMEERVLELALGWSEERGWISTTIGPDTDKSAPLSS